MTDDHNVLLDIDNNNIVSLYDGKGYVKLVDVMPRVVPRGRTGDIAIVQGARVSYGSSDLKSITADRALIRHLVEHYHTSPLEMAEVKFELRAPLYVIAQLIRHRTASVNSESRRYVETPEEYYTPPPRSQSSINKQCSIPMDMSDWDDAKKDTFVNEYSAYVDSASHIHEQYLNLVRNYGIAREVARTGLPQSAMSSIVWKCDLHNFFKMCRLRMAPDAQQEIQELSTQMFNLVYPYFPDTCDAVKEFWFNSMSFSQTEQSIIKSGQYTDHEEVINILGQRRAAAFLHKLKSLGML